jgi:hypothetical protein
MVSNPKKPAMRHIDKMARADPFLRWAADDIS